MSYNWQPTQVHMDLTHNLKYTKKILEAFTKVITNEYSPADASFLEIEGLSGIMYRKFINYLVSQVDMPRYLEIGSWKGSTLCSVLAGNSVSTTNIDNWCQSYDSDQSAQDIYNKFLINLNKYKSDNNSSVVIREDWRNVNYNNIGKFNIYMFDGPHDENDHFDALNLALPALTEEFVLIIDDWNTPNVVDGTMRALRSLNFSIDSIAIESAPRGTYPSVHMQHSNWHNGYFIASVKK